MKPTEINALLTKADGWTGEHEGNPCKWCGLQHFAGPAIKRPRCSGPDYTKSYPDLARVEAKVYGDEYRVEWWRDALEDKVRETDPGADCGSLAIVHVDWFLGFGEDGKAKHHRDDIESGYYASEVAARAECCAKASLIKGGLIIAPSDKDCQAWAVLKGAFVP